MFMFGLFLVDSSVLRLFRHRSGIVIDYIVILLFNHQNIPRVRIRIKKSQMKNLMSMDIKERSNPGFRQPQPFCLLSSRFMLLRPFFPTLRYDGTLVRGGNGWWKYIVGGGGEGLYGSYGRYRLP